VLGSRLVRNATLTLFATLLLYGGACASDATDPPAPGNQPDIEGLVYLGNTNDDGAIVLLAAEASGGSTLRITTPEDGATLAEPAAFTFEPGPSARFRAPPRARRPSFSIGELFGPERLAHAHGDPMNGEAFLLTFGTEDEPHLLRVFTDQRIYEPDADEWAALAAAGELTLVVRMGVFEEGRLPRGSGPFESAPLHFSISGP
jgi:hypothetical protein